MYPVPHEIFTEKIHQELHRYEHPNRMDDGISGAQETDVFRQVLDEAWAERG